MEINLEQLGLDIESIKSRVEDEVVEQLTENITSSCVDTIKSKICGAVLQRVDSKINELVEKSLLEKYQPVDTYGNAIGEPTNIRELFVKSCTAWWTAPVDEKGNTNTGKWGKHQTRAEWFAKKVFDEIVEKDLKEDYNKIVSAGIAKAKEVLTKNIHESITKNWNTR